MLLLQPNPPITLPNALPQVLLNALVFVAWQVTARNVGELSEWRDEHETYTYSEKMEAHFLDSSHTAADLIKRPHTMVLSAFSHQGYDHIMTNMGTLWAFYPPCMKLLGPRGFARLYTTGIISSKLLPLYFRRYLALSRGQRPPDDRTRSLGASGAISAVVAWVCLSCPHDKAYLTIPTFGDKGIETLAPLSVCGLLWLIKDIQGASGVREPGEKANIDYDAHIGGAAGGAAAVALARLRERYAATATSMVPRARALSLSLSLSLCLFLLSPLVQRACGGVLVYLAAGGGGGSAGLRTCVRCPCG